MKKYLIGFIVGVAITAAGSAYADDVVESLIGKSVQGEFPVKIDGKQLTTQAAVIEGTSYLPVRAIGEALNKEVSFDASKGIELKAKGASTVNPRIAEINKELEEWVGKLQYVTEQAAAQTQLVLDLESKVNSGDPLVSREAQGSLNFQRPRLDGIKELKKQAEEDIAKLQAELAELQKQQ